MVGALAATRIAGGPAPESTPVVSDPVPQPAQVSWATGQVLHVGDRTIDVGVGVKAYVRTSVGFVVADPAGVVHSVVDGKVSDVGRTDAKHPHLVSDPTGTQAGWVELDGDRPGFVVLDQATGDTTRNDDATAPGMGLLADQRDPAYFYAISGGVTYWRDLRGAVAVDLASGDVRVVDARTGERVALDLHYAFATGYEWLDGHRLAVLAQEARRSPVQLLTCVVPAGTCDVTVDDLGSFDDLLADGFQRPVGQKLDGG